MSKAGYFFKFPVFINKKAGFPIKNIRRQKQPYQTPE